MKGTTVIFNSEYIDEVSRLRDRAKLKYENESLEDVKAKLKVELDKWEKKLEDTINFQDIVEFTMNMEIPSITMVKTLRGYEIPAKHLQAV